MTDEPKLKEAWQTDFWSEPTLRVLDLPIAEPRFSTEFLAGLFLNKHENHTFLKQLIDRDSDLIFIKDLAGRFALVNRTVANIYGGNPEELVGKRDSDFNSNIREVERFQMDDDFVLKNKIERLIPFEQVSAKNGETRCLRTIKLPILNASGEVTHLLGISSDITQEFESKILRKNLLQKKAPDGSRVLTEVKRPHVLVVDDDQAVREVTQELLEGAGYAVSTAGDGLEGLAEVQRLGEDLKLIILDLLMPRADGEEMLRQVSRIAPSVPVIICTGCSDSPKYPQALYILTKPYNPRQLLAYAEHLV